MLSLASIFNQLKHLLFLLRDDPEARSELRRLLLGIVTCLAALYAGFSLVLSPRQKTLAQRLARHRELTASAPVQTNRILAAKAAQLEQELTSLEEKLRILRLKKRFLGEQWQLWGDSDRFNQVIFTLLPGAEVDIEPHLKQMNRLEPGQSDGFTIHSVQLTGEVDFATLYQYLTYLEQRPEVSVIRDLAAKRLPASGYAKPAGIEFSLVVGRASLSSRNPNGPES